jgi:hypothetical protein
LDLFKELLIQLKFLAMMNGHRNCVIQTFDLMIANLHLKAYDLFAFLMAICHSTQPLLLSSTPQYLPATSLAPMSLIPFAEPLYNAITNPSCCPDLVDMKSPFTKILPPSPMRCRPLAGKAVSKSCTCICGNPLK